MLLSFEIILLDTVMNENTKLVEEELMRDQQFLDISVLE